MNVKGKFSLSLRKVIQWIVWAIVFFFPLSLQAQSGNKLDSIRNAAIQKRRMDSLARATQRMELKRKNDSLVIARKQQRSKDSLERVQNAQRRRDSLSLQRYRQQYGEEKYQQKLIEMDRLKKQEEKFRLLRIEDSIRLAKKRREEFVKDSLLQDKRNRERQLFVKDSIQKELAKREEERLQKIKKEQEKEAARLLEIQKKQQAQEQKLRERQLQRTKDSLEAVQRAQERLERQMKEMQQKRWEDSLIARKMEEEERKRMDEEKEWLKNHKGMKRKPSEIEMLVEDFNTHEAPVTLPQSQIDSLRKVDSVKFVLSSFLYRLKKSTEFSGYFGVSNYLGDLGGNSGFGKKLFYDNNFKKRNFFYGFSVSHYRGEWLGFRFSYIAGKISASDQDVAFTSYTDPAYRRFKRNLDFQTKISEWSFMTECYPFKLFSPNHAVFHFKAQPYVLGGVGRFAFNPQGSYYDEIAEDYLYIDLQPLHTEGQGMAEYPDRKPYSLHQWNMPYGLGVRYLLSRRTSLSFEYVGRKLFTDYLDDVSTTYIDPELFSTYLNPEDAFIAKQVNNKSRLVSPDHYLNPGEDRGCSKHNDFYYSFNLRFSFRISKLK